MELMEKVFPAHVAPKQPPLAGVHRGMPQEIALLAELPPTHIAREGLDPGVEHGVGVQIAPAAEPLAAQATLQGPLNFAVHGGENVNVGCSLDNRPRDSRSTVQMTCV